MNELEDSVAMIETTLIEALFRSNVLRAYGHRCAFLGSRVPQALDAAHIQPFMNSASNHIQNGIAVRKDVHSLFDAGLLALGDDYSILVSPIISQKPYADLAGRKMRLPTDAGQHPSIEAVRLHRMSFRAGAA
jgi:putative restriction endonuclease